MLPWVLSWGKICDCIILLILSTDRQTSLIQESQTVKSHAGDSILMLDGIRTALRIGFSSRDGMRDLKLTEEFWESWFQKPSPWPLGASG